MITGDQEAYVLSRAYVPEHIVSLMVLISGAEPFLINDCLCYVKGDWLIVIGYPLEGEFSEDCLGALVHEATDRFKPRSISMAAPAIPGQYLDKGTDVERDSYYRLDLTGYRPKTRLMREVNRAMQELTVEKNSDFTKEHWQLIDEFIKRDKPSGRLKELYRSMERYVSQSATAALLDTRDRRGRLSAFYVVELAATDFAVYVVGCHSKKNYVPHASDLLFYEMAKMAEESGKSHINLGLGVNDGIRRFKEKWGGRPYLKYAFCEYKTEHGSPARSVKSVLDAMKGL